jgi:hypothetical protein
MPCYRCGARQVDPDRGESPWKRGVRADRQVLICPTCQSSCDWTGELDRCPVCRSAHLVRRLGEVECRDCGYVRDPGSPSGTGLVPGAAASSSGTGSAGAEPRAEAEFGETPGLAEEVELALARVLGKSRRPAGIA